MKTNLNYLLGLLVAGSLATGCADPVSDNASEETTSSLASLNESLESSVATAIDLGDAVGLIDIHTGPRPGETTPVLTVRLIVFNGAAPTTPPFKTGGLDIGTVTVDHAGASQTLYKVAVREGGVVYESMSKPERGAPPTGGLTYVAGSPVVVSTSGTDVFAAQSFTVETSASADLTNLADGAVIPVGQDLTINWSGGTADSVHIIIADLPPQPGMGPNGQGGKGPGGKGPGGKGKDGKGPGGKGPGGKGPQGPGMGPKPVYRAVVATSAGSFTIPAADVTAALAALKGTGFVISVNQRIITDLTATTGTIKALMHTADGVRVTR